MDPPDRMRVTSSEEVRQGGGGSDITKSINSIIYDVTDLTEIATTMPLGRYGARHIDRWSVSMASCEATR